MRPIIPLLMVISLILLSGCANPFTKYQCWDDSTADSIDACPAPEVRQSCRESGGYLCGQSDGSAPPTIIRCAVEWMDSTESYCCPIECGECDPEVLANCTPDNPCFRTRCDWTTDFQCEISPIRPCDGNEICDKNEFAGYLEPPIIQLYNTEIRPGHASAREGLRLIGCYPDEDWDEQFESSDTITHSTFVTIGSGVSVRLSPCKDVEGSTGSHASLGSNLVVALCAPNFGWTQEDFIPESSECPQSCPSDGDAATADHYDFTKQECVHTPCDFVCGNGVCEESEFFSDDTAYVTICYDDCGGEVEALPEEEVVNYKFSRYADYATFVRPTLEELTGIKEMGGRYGGTEGKDQLREDGKVYFIIFKHGDWGAVRYWAVEVNAETGELINYKEVTKGENQINYNEIWWYEP